MNQFPPSRFDFFQKFVEIFAAQGAPPVSMTPVVHLDSSGEFAVGDVEAGGKFMIPAANLPPMSLTPVATGVAP